jgi:hypothetical protein
MRVRRPVVGISNWITIAALAGSMIVYAVRLEGRQDAADVKFDERARELEAIQAHRKETDERILAELAYIRARVDQALDAR